MVGVLDLGFGQGGAAMDAPVDRLEPFVDETFFEEGVEILDDFASYSLVMVEYG